MFLARRSLQTEYFDSPGRSATELDQHYRSLTRINSLFYLRDTIQRNLPRLLGPQNCRQLSILDLGAGDGKLGEKVHEWARLRGWDWTFTNLDINAASFQFSKGNFVQGSVLEIPYADDSFDVVIASQMTHHLQSEEHIIKHFREAWRVARRGISINDLHRNYLLYAVLWCVLHAGKFPVNFRNDGLLSVRRGFQLREWRDLAARAAIPNARVHLYFGARLILEATKQ